MYMCPGGGSIDVTPAVCYHFYASCLAEISHVLTNFQGFMTQMCCSRLASQAGVAERYTRLSQKQVPQGLRVRISPSVPLICHPTSKIACEAILDVFIFGFSSYLRQTLRQLS